MFSNPSIENLCSGSHVCSVVSCSEDLLKIVIPFFTAGLRKNEKSVFIVSDKTRDIIVTALKDTGVDLEKMYQWGQLAFMPPEDTYIKDACFDPARLFRFLNHLVSEAVLDGFTGLRLMGEASWYNSGLPGTRKLIEYESTVNCRIGSAGITALCLYDERIFDRDVLKDALLAHPKVIFAGEAYNNPYYVVPETFRDRQFSKVGKSYDELKEDIIKKKG